MFPSNPPPHPEGHGHEPLPKLGPDVPSEVPERYYEACRKRHWSMVELCRATGRIHSEKEHVEAARKLALVAYSERKDPQPAGLEPPPPPAPGPSGVGL